MNSFKRFISILLAAMMALSVCGGAFAETIPEREVYSGTCGAEGDNLNWTFYTINGVLSIKGTGDMADWFYGYYAPWYSYRYNLNTVLIYSGVTSIGDYAFYSCASLDSVTIPGNVTRIGDSAFYGCASLAAATIGGSVASIGDLAFYGCSSLTSIEIPESVTSIGAAAFNGCGSLASALFKGAPPASFGNNVFDGCAPGFIIYYTEDHAAQWAPNGETEWNGYPIAPAPVTSGSCGSFVNWEFDPETGTLTISGWASMYDYESASDVPWYHLRDEIITVVIEEDVSSISAYAFADCVNMTSVTIPDTVTHIGNSAFYNCRSLISVDLPSGITEIEYDTFGFCYSLEHVTIPEGVTYIGYQAFAECMSLDGLVLPETLEIIDGRAFHDCQSLTSLYLPASLYYIGEQAFLGCFSLPGFEVDPDNAVFCAYEGVLFNKDMTELIFCPAGKTGDYIVPASVTTIGTEAFYECFGITSITLPEGLLTISSYAFGGCYGLTSIFIPGSVSSIGDYAFYACGNMQYIVFLAGLNFVYGWYIFEGCPEDMLVCYTSEYEETWNPDGTTAEWNDQPLSLACRITYTGAYVGTDYVPYGWDATLPECSEEGLHYLFTCNGEPWWFGENVTEDVTVFVSTEPNVHALFFFVNGDLYMQTTCAYGEEIEMPVYYTENGYTFSGWESDDGQCYQFMPDYDVWYYGYTERIEYTVTIIYQYNDGTVIDEVTYICYYGDAICEPCPVIEGYSCYPDPVCYYVEDDVVLYVTYTPLVECSLTIHYVDSVYYAEGLIVEVCDPLITEGYYGSFYSLVNPDVIGYTHDSAYESGWLYEDTDLYVMYDPIAYELHVDYVYDDGAEAAPSYSEMVLYGHPYCVESPIVDGATPDLPYIEGDMFSLGLCVTVTYTREEHVLTIVYQYDDGTLIDEASYVLYYGEEYWYASPVIEGYSCYPGTVSGCLYEDTTVYVTYFPLPVHELIIHYVDSAYYADGQLYEVCEPLVTEDYHGSFYSLVNPDVPGYTHDSAYESGWLYEDTNLYVMYDPIEYELHVDYVFEDGSAAAPAHTEMVLYGHPYYVESPHVEGYTPDLPYIEGDMYYFGLCVTVTYSPLPCPIHVILMYEDGTVISEETYIYLYGEPYSIPLPEIEGYAPDPSVIAGITSGETWYYVYYHELVNYTLTVHCLDKEYFNQGVIFEVCDPIVLTAGQGAPYTVELPEIEGYTSGMTSVSGILDGDADIYVMYMPNVYTLTLHFVYRDGTPAFDDYVEQVLYGRPYYVDVPTLQYYYPDTNSVSGTMPACDLTFTVVYDPVNIPGDVDGDGAFTFTDISALSLFLTGEGDLAEGVNADFNGDGEVNFLDLSDMYMALIG